MAVQNGAGQTRLLGVWRGIYSPNLMDDKAVVNHHMFREAGWQVGCVAKQHEGLQCFWFPIGDDIPLDYDTNKYKLYILAIDKGKKPVHRDHVICQPQIINSNVDEERMELEPSEVSKTKKVASLEDEDDKTAVTEATTGSDEDFNWKETLRNCLDDVLVKTLENTIQCFPDWVEAETRSYPTQHRHRRLICGFTCAQLFVVLFVDYLWVKLLQRESQVPGSYEDFCSEVGAPSKLLTNNSKIQMGKKFTTVDWCNMTPIFSPHLTARTKICQRGKMSKGVHMSNTINNSVFCFKF
eukprot:8524893-Ditylum_brightwellii.AAC.1